MNWNSVTFPFLAIHYSSYKACLPKVWTRLTEQPFCLLSKIDWFKSNKLEFAYMPLLGPFSPLSPLSYLFRPQLFPWRAQCFLFFQPAAPWPPALVLHHIMRMQFLRGSCRLVGKRTTALFGGRTQKNKQIIGANFPLWRCSTGLEGIQQDLGIQIQAASFLCDRQTLPTVHKYAWKLIHCFTFE